MADDAAAPDGELSEETREDEAEADTSTESVADESGEGSGEDAEEGAGEEQPATAKAKMSHVRLATILGLVAVVALAGLCGWLGFRAYESRKAADERSLFLQVGRQAALNLTTIDFEHADEDVQRVLDSSTGTFYDDFQARAQPFKEVVKQAKSKSVGTIAEAGVESETDDGAEVLVAVTVKTSNAGAAEQEPRAWRMRITVQKVGDEAKVANVRFVS
ncbi:tetratricopeptide repeat protein [Mycolicibacterium stellerae]|uniref:Mce protein n=1 Tax=Mycolicibacterium stellerae TaxID=2358193 RepID=UPI000F0AF78D|nr:Mce protein [Mycolicibacterium stellerae]